MGRQTGCYNSGGSGASSFSPRNGGHFHQIYLSSSGFRLSRSGPRTRSSGSSGFLRPWTVVWIFEELHQAGVVSSRPVWHGQLYRS